MNAPGIFKEWAGRFSKLTPVLILAAVYFCAAKFGLSLAIVNKSATAVWPPTGIALVALLLWGYRLWPGIFLGAFLANLWTQGPPETTLVLTLCKTVCIAFGNTLEAVYGAWLVREFANGSCAFERSKDIFKFIFLAAILSTLVSATFGVTSLCLCGWEHWNHYSEVWLTWWLGDVVSNLTVAPTLLIWLARKPPRFSAKQGLEATGLILLLILVAHTVFMQGPPFGGKNLPLEYLGIPPLLWAAFRFGQRGAITSAFVLSATALWGTMHRCGPFAIPDANESLLLLQAFTATVTVTTLVLASLVLERRRSGERLETKNAISDILADSPSLLAAASRILLALSEVGGWEAATILSVDRGTNELFCEAVWSAAPLTTADLETVARRRKVGPGTSFAGRVWSSGEAGWVTNLNRNGDAPSEPDILARKFPATICFPLEFGDEVVGVIEGFGHELKAPDEETLRWLESVGRQIGQFIEHKRGEEVVRKNEELFRQVTESINEVFWMSDVQKNQILYVSPGYEEIWGRSRESLRASPRNWLEAIHPDDRGRVLEAALTKQISGQYDEEYRIVRPDGIIRWIQDRAFPIEDKSGKVYRIVGIAEDITERKRAEESLRESEARKSAIMQSALDAIITIDHEGRIVDFNLAAEKIFGHLRSRILGKGIAELIIPPALRDWFQHGMADLFVEDQGPLLGSQIEMSALRADGTEFPVEFTVTRVVLDGPVMFTAFFRDVSGRKRAEKQLTMLGHAMETITEPIYITDLQNRIMFVNRAFEQTYGYVQREILGQTPFILHSSKNSPSLLGEILEQTKLGGWRGEVVHRRKDGLEFPVVLSTSQIKDAIGRPAGLMRLARDVTERKRIEAELRQLPFRIIEAQEDERLRVARELHDSVNQVIASAKMRLRKAENILAGANPAAAEILNRCYELLVQALEENRRIAHNLRRSDLDEFGLAAACRNFCAELRLRTSLEVKCRISRVDRRLPQEVELNLFRVVQEAINNVEKHSNAKIVRLHLAFQKDSVVLKIQDDGRGFDSNGSYPVNGQARGIGLTHMRERAASLGGTCKVASKPNAGVTITVRVPCPKAA